MDDIVKDVFHKASIMQDIEKRVGIIQNYQRLGWLERDKAVKEILKLRVNDEDVAKITVARLVVNAIPFSQANDQHIIAELQMQINILRSKLLKINNNEYLAREFE